MCACVDCQNVLNNKSLTNSYLNKKIIMQVIEMEEHFVRRLIYVKALLGHGIDHSEMDTPIDTALAILHFDNAIEMLMRIILEFYHASHIQKERVFDDLINNVRRLIKNRHPEINPDELLRTRELRNLHLVRNNIQHLGVIPAAEEVSRFRSLTENIINSVTSKLFKVQFSELSLGAFIKDQVVRELYTKADEAFSNENYSEAIIFCVAAFETAKNMEQGRIYGSGFTFQRMAARARARAKNTIWEIFEYADKLAEEIEVMKLRLDYKKYQKYREISTKLQPFLKIASRSTPIEDVLSKTRKLLSNDIKNVKQPVLREYARFCLSLAIESIFRWESVPRRAWYEF